MTVTLTLHIENHYARHGLIVTTRTVTVPPPPSEEDAYTDWKGQHIHAVTGADRDGHAGYFVTVKESSNPDVIPVGQSYEFV